MKKLILFSIIVGVFFNFSIVNADISDGLIHFYKFDGNSKDFVGNLDGIDSNISYDFGTVNGGAYMSGTNTSNVILDPDPFDGVVTTASVSFWYNLSESSSDTTLISDIFGHYVYPRVIYSQSLNRLTVYYRLNGVTKSFNVISYIQNFPLGVPVHFVLTFDVNSGVYLYLNNVLVGSNTSTGSTFDSGTLPLYLGYEVNVSRPLNGFIDNVFFWNRVITLDEIELLYNTGYNNTYPFIASIDEDQVIAILDDNMASTTEAINSNSFGLAIIIVLLFVIFLGFAFNNMNLKAKEKKW